MQKLKNSVWNPSFFRAGYMLITHRSSPSQPSVHIAEHPECYTLFFVFYVEVDLLQKLKSN